MNCILLELSEEKKKLPVGSSKFFGNPDVWEDFRWPSLNENGEDYDLTFICQINCTETALFDTENLLPKTGMLYFFYDLDMMPAETEGAAMNEDGARVLYYGGASGSLSEMLLTDQEGNDIGFPEMKIRFSSPSEAGKSGAQSLHFLLGSTPGGMHKYVPAERLLLQIGSFETDSLSLEFINKGALRYFIDGEKLMRRDFSGVYIRQTGDGKL